MTMTRAQQIKRRHVARTRAELARANPVAAAFALQRMHSHMTTISIAIYMADDGHADRELLSHLGWMLGIGAEIAVQRNPGTAEARRLHAALRTVVAMSVDGGAWQSSQAPALDSACNAALALFTAHPNQGLDLIPSADWIASRIRDGQARLTDVAGAEIYSQPPAGAAA